MEHDETTHDHDAGAEGGEESDSAAKLPAAPSDDDTPLGDTDQHSRSDS